MILFDRNYLPLITLYQVSVHLFVKSYRSGLDPIHRLCLLLSSLVILDLDLVGTCQVNIEMTNNFLFSFM